jgi:hypothetical protein
MKAREYFHSGSDGINGILFRRDNRPNTAIFKLLFDSILFKSNIEDTAKTTTPGHVLRASDSFIIESGMLYPNAHSVAVMAHQIPVIKQPEEGDEIISEEEVGGIKLIKYTTTLNNLKRLGYWIEVLPTQITIESLDDSIEIQDNKIGVSEKYRGKVSLNGLIEPRFLTGWLGATFTLLNEYIEIRKKDTNTIQLLTTSNGLEGHLKYQNSTSINHSVTTEGLKSDIRLNSDYLGVDNSGVYVKRFFDIVAGNGVEVNYNSSTRVYTIINTGGQVTFLEEIQVDNLLEKINVSSLVSGQYYLINDFRTIYDRPDFEGNGRTIKYPIETIYADNEKIIVQALSNNTLKKEAWSLDYPQDYLEYDINIRETFVNKNPTKGKIIFRRDEKNNEMLFDFRGVTYKRYDKDGDNNFIYPYDTGTNNSQIVSVLEGDCWNIKQERLEESFFNWWNSDFDLPCVTYKNVQASNFGLVSERNTINALYGIWKDKYECEIYNSIINVNSGGSNIIRNFFADSFIQVDRFYENIIESIWDSNIEIDGSSLKFSKNDIKTLINTNIYAEFFENKVNIINSSTFNTKVNNNIFNHVFECIFNGSKFENNEFKKDCFGNTFLGEINDNVFNDEISGNSFNINSFIWNNTFQYVNGCEFGVCDIENNIITSNFQSNVINASLVRNNIGGRFENNYLSGSIEENKLFNIIQSKIETTVFSYNDISNLEYGEYAGEITNNIIKGKFEHNYIENMKYNSIEGHFAFLTGESYPEKALNINYNSIKGEFQHNSIKENFNYNSIKGKFKNNSIKENFEYNSINGNFHNNIINRNCKYNIINGELNNNIIGENFTNNIIFIGSLNVNFGDNFINNIIQCHIKLEDLIDFTSATHVKANYTCWIFRDTEGIIKLKYIDNNGEMQIVNPTS